MEGNTLEIRAQEQKPHVSTTKKAWIVIGIAALEEENIKNEWSGH